jgi:hypothetical protein
MDYYSTIKLTFGNGAQKNCQSELMRLLAEYVICLPEALSAIQLLPESPLCQE